MRTLEGRCKKCGCPLVEVNVDDDRVLVRWRVRNTPYVAALRQPGRERSTRPERRTDHHSEPVERVITHPECQSIVAWCDRDGEIPVPFAGLRARHAQGLREQRAVKWRLTT